MDWSTGMTSSISWPYTINPLGVTESSRAIAKISLDRLLTLLSTNVGQRPMSPRYGVDWSGSLFENEDNAESATSEAIYAAVGQWLPELEITELKINSVFGTGIQNVTISLTFPDETNSEITIRFDTFNYDGMVNTYAN
jgi:phage baseplate assembly protein W